MKISHRLWALSALSAGGLALVAGVSFVAVTSIQSDLEGLTLRAAPLQTKTYELQERTERLMGALLRLSLVRNKEDADKVLAGVTADSQAIDKLRGEIRALDPKSAAENADFRNAQADIARAVDKRLADEAAYRRESESARAALKKAEDAVAVTRKAVQQIGVEAGQAADKAQDSGRRLAQSMKQVLTAQSKLKEVALVVSEVDLASNRFRLGPLKDKFKSPLDSVLRLEVEAGSDDLLKDTRALAGTLLDATTKDGSGLLAQRAAVLAAKPEAKAEAEAAYQKQRKAVLGPMEEQVAKLGATLDAAEVQAVKQRQVLEAALKLRNEPGGVVGTSEEVSLQIRDMVGSLRLLMLAASEAEAAAAHKDMGQLGDKLAGHMATMRAGLLKMGRPPLASQVDDALASMALVSASVGKVAQSKQQLLASEALMAQSLANLKTLAARQASLGEAQAKSVGERQSQVVAEVDRQVRSALVAILGIAGAIIVVSALASWRIVRRITQRLDEAVHVAEQVSLGHLVEVPAAHGNDETARLMTALASMVGTLQGIVGNIRQAADRIRSGTDEISRGNLDLSSRTEQQASELQQTAASVEELTATVRHNAESARTANTLADAASGVAARGGAVVGEVVATMSDIQGSSRRIGEIVGVIDGIAFQTNILALNAAVEAARAGEHGRGFAVVASEVRALAGKSAEAARQVKDIVTQSVGTIDSGSALVQSAGQTMQDIVQQVQQVTTLISEIARASEEQAESVGSVGSAVSHLDTLTQQNAALAEQGSAAAESLLQQADGLTQAIAVFRVGGDAVPA